PQLLQLSGIGNADHLRGLDISVVHELKGVGENLQDHLQIRLQYKVKNVKTLNGVANSLFGKAAMAAEYFLFRTGPLTMPPSQAGEFGEHDPAQPTAQVDWHQNRRTAHYVRGPRATLPAVRHTAGYLAR